METNLLKIDKWVHNFWKKNKIRERTLKLRKGKKKFYFLDGPPYATGYVHIGTGRNKTIKDYYLRYNRMKGYDIWAQPGYDTHGLPIESKVEKKLGIVFKNEIEKMGIDKFNKECAKFATKFVDFMAETFIDMGVWYDWDHPYYTFTNEYIDSAWYTLKVAYDKGLLYKGKYPVHICPRCETASAFYEINYKKVEDTSIVAKFRIKGKKSEYLLIFTTTPWTLPANTGVMVHPKSTYVRAKFGDEIWICSEDTLESIAKFVNKEYKVLGKFPGQKLVGLEYEAPFKELPLQKNINPRVVPSARFVDAKEGTGLVHSAPGHGQEDYQVGMEHGLALLSPVKLNGRYTEEAGRFADRFVKDCDLDIIEDLRNRKLLIGTINIKHDYPFCWRCDTALLFASVPQWFFKVTKFKNKLLELNKKIKWIPEWGEKRFHDWLTNLSDWPISRQRYWGIPIPIWTCKKCNELKMIGSIYDLPKKLKDVHRPFIDKITFKCKCGGVMNRIPDILDVWFDSGVASWASIGYPKHEDLFKSMWPPAFNTEGTDQFRGWWNSQLLTSYVTFGKLPYRAIRVHGLTWDKTGHPMSKSKGNFVQPQEIYKKYGRDALRWYLPHDDPSLEFYFDWEGRGKETMKFFNVFFNTINYVESNSIKTKPNKLGIEDKWIISKVNSLLKAVTNFNDNYLEYQSIQSIENFISDDFSRFYIKLVREKAALGDKSTAYALYYVLDKVIRMLAPIIPFSTEYVYQHLLKNQRDPESIHITNWPKADKKLINKKLEEDMKVIQGVVSAVLSSREQVNRGIRWPIKSVTVTSGSKKVREAVEKHAELVKQMTNCWDINISSQLKDAKFTVKPDYKKLGPKLGGRMKEFASELAKMNAEEITSELERNGKISLNGLEALKEELVIREQLPEGIVGARERDFAVYLDASENEKMLASGYAREITRKVQDLRKRERLVKKDRIVLIVECPKSLWSKVKGFLDKSKVGAKRIEFGKVKGKREDEFKVKGERIKVGF